MNGAMVRGQAPARKSAVSLSPVALSHPVKGRVLSSLVSGSPSVNCPANAAHSEHDDQHDPEDQIDLLAQYVTGVIKWPSEEHHSHA